MSILVACIILVLLATVVYFYTNSQKLATGASPKTDAPKPDAPKPDAPKSDAPKPVAPNPVAPKPDAPKPVAPNMSPNSKLRNALSSKNRNLSVVTNQGSKNCSKPLGVSLDVFNREYVNKIDIPGRPVNICLTDGTPDEKTPDAAYFWTTFDSPNSRDYMLFQDMNDNDVLERLVKKYPMAQAQYSNRLNI